MQSKKTTIIDIARQLNITKSTVSRALRNHQGIGLRTKTRVQQLAKELNYEPNQTAIFFKQRKTYLIGVILPSLSNGFFSSLVSGIEDVAYKKNYSLLLGQSMDEEEREKKIVETMKNHRVDGMLISIAKNTDNYEHFEVLKKNNIPVVFFDRIPQMQDIHSIASKLETGMVEAVNLLVKKGNKLIALINGPEKLPASKERHDAFIMALKKNKIKHNDNYVVRTDISVEGNNAAMKELLALPKRPTAVIAFNDYVAMDVIHYAKRQKIKINKDISFVSFANEAICNYMEHPPLASVEQFPFQQGEKAAETLLELFEYLGDENQKTFHNILLPSQLVVRVTK